MKKPLLAFLTWTLLTALVFAGELSVHFIDVGQGDSALVIGPDGTRVLIDGGSAGEGANAVVPYLSALGVTGLDYSIMTHWHTDHYGGMDEVFNAGYLPSVSALDRGNTDMPSGTQVTQYLSAVGTKRNTAFLGQTIALGDGATIEVVAVNGQTPLGNINVNGASQEENGRSVAVVVRYKDFDVYIGGDLTGGGNGTANVETNVANYIGQVEIAKASHHGSSTSSQASVVSAFNPAIVIYSCGKDNPYGHPSASVVDRFSPPSAVRMQWGTTVGDTGNGTRGWTSADGAIAIKTNGYLYTAQPAGTTDVVELVTFENPYPGIGVASAIITELLPDPLVSQDAYGEWIEFGNLAQDMTSVAGTKLRTGAQEVTLHSPILLASYKRTLIGADGHRSRNGDVFVPICWPEGTLGLPNFGGSVELEGPGAMGTPTHSVAWPADFPPFFGTAAEITAFAWGAPFALSSGTFGSGDKGTPGAKNSTENVVYPTVVTVAQSFYDDAIEFRLEAPGQPFQFYALAASLSVGTGFDALGVHLDLDLMPLVNTTALLPGSIGALNFDRKTVKWPLPGNPAMVGQTAYAQFATFDATLAGTAVSTVDDFTIQ